MKHSSNPTFEPLNRQWNSNISQQHKHRDKPQPVSKSIVTIVHHNMPGEPLDCTRSSVEVCEVWHENRGPGWETPLYQHHLVQIFGLKICVVTRATAWNVSFSVHPPWAMQHSGLPTDPYAVHFPIIEMIMEWSFFYLSDNKWKYISDFLPSHHHWQLYTPHWQLGSVWSTTPSGEHWLSWEHILIFGALWASYYRLLLHGPNSPEKLSKCKINTLSILKSQHYH